MAVAMEWVTRITTVAFVMVAPGLLGYWIDGKFGIRLLAPVGFLLGVCGGIWYLLAITGALKNKSRPPAGRDLPRKDKQP
jgi:hypothetical protein